MFQLGQALDINFFTSFIDTWYPASEEFGDVWFKSTITSLAELTSLGERRYGGIYRNPNLMGEYVLFLYVIFLLLSAKQNIRRQFQYIIAAFVFISILFTGSRTASIIFILVFLIKYYGFFKKNVIAAMIVGFSLVVYFLIVLDLATISNIKAFNFSQAFQPGRSGEVKFSILANYLDQLTIPDNFNLGSFLFGNIWDGIYHFDTDIGYIIYGFGFIGLFAFLQYFIFNYLKAPKDQKIKYLLLLYTLPATIIFNYRIFMLFMLILSLGYRKSTNDPSEIKEDFTG